MSALVKKHSSGVTLAKAMYSRSLRQVVPLMISIPRFTEF